MSSTTALRPGVALGPYPQREDLRDNWLDRAAGLLFVGFGLRLAFADNAAH